MVAPTHPTVAPGDASPGTRRSRGAGRHTRGDESGSGGFRPDVEGLRAVAIGLVLWFHAGLRWFHGGFAGVDVFFVISGFLITGLLVREVSATGRISLSRFYARRAKRLLPAAATVLVATTFLTWEFLPKVRWEVYGGDIASAAAYVVNWRLAAQSVDYLAEGVEPSPVQHFWSLAVEEQFYIVWPILLAVLALLVRRRRWPARAVMAVGLTAIAVPSLIWSVHRTAVEPASAYFVTTTRLWELGIGSLVAVGATLWARLPRVAAATLGWAGLATIAVGALVQSTATPWPGTAALVPTLGTAAVIVAGFAAGRAGPATLLGMRPMVWIGGLSYSLYLWHWPLLVAASAHFGSLGEKRGLAIVALSFIPAWLTHHVIENPFRHARFVSRSPRLALSLGLNFSLAGMLAGIGLVATTPASTTTPQALAAPGASVLGGSARPDAAKVSHASTGVMTPDPLRAVGDLPQVYADGCQVKESQSRVATCTYGPRDADVTVAIVGDSKMAEWLPALRVIARERGWRIKTYTKAACSWTARMTGVYGRPYTECRDWGEEVLHRLTGDERPDLVLTSGVKDRASEDASGPATFHTVVDGYVENWQALGRVGVPVLALSNNPGPDVEAYECVSEHEHDYMQACAYPYERTGGSRALRAASGRVDTATFVDMDGWICPGRRECPPVIGNVLVYRQGSHLTATYAHSLAPSLDRALSRGLHDLGIGDLHQ